MQRRKLDPAELVEGRLYKLDGYGLSKYIGLDHYMGETTAKFEGIEVRRTHYPRLDVLYVLDAAPPPAADAANPWDALEAAREWIGHAPHGDNCYVSAHYPGDPGDRCNCGKDSIESYIDDVLAARGK